MTPPRGRERGTTGAGRRWLALLALALGAGCGPEEPLARRLERDLLLREREALRRQAARLDPAADETAALVVVPATLLRDLIAAALPVQTTVAGRFRITADSARLDFQGGLALVRLDARVEWADRDDVSAGVEVLGVLEILDLETAAGALTGRVEILGFETGEVRLGALSPPAGRLLDELARRPASELNELLARIEIPVRLAPVISLPAVEEEELSIQAAELPLEARIQQVRVGGGRLWIHIGVVVPEPGA